MAFTDQRFPTFLQTPATKIIVKKKILINNSIAVSDINSYYPILGVRKFIVNISNIPPGSNVALKNLLLLEADGFRYRDWDDYSATSQNIGTGDGNEVDFQLRKKYSVSTYDIYKTITKPVVNTVKIYLDNVEQVSGWTIDVTTGIVTFVTAPALNVIITADFQYDIPVIFLDVSIQIVLSGNINRDANSITLIELFAGESAFTPVFLEQQFPIQATIPFQKSIMLTQSAAEGSTGIKQYFRQYPYLGVRKFTFGINSLDIATSQTVILMLLMFGTKGFRFRDWDDYSGTSELIGTGDNVQTTFQIRKKYQTEGYYIYKTITKPITNTVKVYFDDVEQVSGFTINYATGIISFTPAPSDGVDITVDFQYDLPVKWLDIELQITSNSFQERNFDLITLNEDFAGESDLFVVVEEEPLVTPDCTGEGISTQIIMMVDNGIIQDIGPNNISLTANNCVIDGYAFTVNGYILTETDIALKTDKGINTIFSIYFELILPTEDGIFFRKGSQITLERADAELWFTIATDTGDYTAVIEITTGPTEVVTMVLNMSDDHNISINDVWGTEGDSGSGSLIEDDPDDYYFRIEPSSATYYYCKMCKTLG